MSVVIHELADGRAVLGCDTDDRVFGPVFPDADEARDFLRWLAGSAPLADERGLIEPVGAGDGRDPRHYDVEGMDRLNALWRFGAGVELVLA